MRVVVFGVIIFLNYLVQSTFLQFFAIYNVIPNTAIVCIISYAILRGDLEGGVFGFTTGLIQDLFFGRVFGMYAIMGLCLGVYTGRMFKNFNRDNIVLPAVYVLGISIFYEYVFYFFNFLFRGRVEMMYFFKTLILPEAVYNAVFAIPIYFGFYLINKQIEKFEKPKEKLFDMPRTTQSNVSNTSSGTGGGGF